RFRGCTTGGGQLSRPRCANRVWRRWSPSRRSTPKDAATARIPADPQADPLTPELSAAASERHEPAAAWTSGAPRVVPVGDIEKRGMLTQAAQPNVLALCLPLQPTQALGIQLQRQLACLAL